MGRKTVTKKIRKNRKRVRINKKKVTEPSQLQDQLTLQQMGPQSVSNLRSNTSARAMLLQKMMQNPTAPTIVGSPIQSNLDKISSQTAQYSAEAKKTQADAEKLKKEREDAHKEAKKYKKDLEKEKLKVKDAVEAKEEAERNKEAVERERRREHEIRKKMLKVTSAQDGETMKDENASLEAQYNEAELKAVEMKSQMEKNALGRENKLMQEKLKQRNSENAGLDKLLKSAAFSKAATTHAELVHKQELADFNNKLLLEQVAKEKEIADNKMKVAGALSKDEMQQYIAKEENAAKNLNIENFGLKHQIFENKVIEKRYDTAKEIRMGKEVEQEKLISKNEALRATSSAISNAKTNLTKKTKDSIGEEMKFKRKNEILEKQIAARKELENQKEEEYKSQAQIAIMESPESIEGMKQLSNIKFQTEQALENKRNNELYMESQKKLNEALISKNVQQNIAMAGFPESASTHIQVNETIKQVNKNKKDLEAKNRVWNEIKSWNFANGPTNPAWPAFIQMNPSFAINESTYQDCPLDHLENILVAFRQFIQRNPQNRSTPEQLVLPPEEEENNFLD